MNRAHHVLVVSILVVSGLASDAHAIPIIWGTGETMTEMGELSPEVAAALKEELGASVTVAFLYERMHVFFCDLWTWNGRHVLHSGDKYWELDSPDWNNILGEELSTKYGTPILYRIPLGAALLVIAAVGYAVRFQFFKTDDEKLAALMNDKRYQKAMDTIFGDDDDESAEVMTVLDEGKFAEAKTQLICDGVAPEPAETNLRKIVDSILDSTNEQIDECLRYAAQLDQDEDWDQCAEVYEQVIFSLPDDDERKAYARNCLDVVEEKRKGNTAEQGDAPPPE